MPMTSPAPMMTGMSRASRALISRWPRPGYGIDVDTTRRTLAPYANRPGWSNLPAIQSGNIYAIETGLARSLWDWVASEYFAKQMHPDAFADVDPVADLRRYHEQFLPVTFDGTWMARLTPKPA